MMPTCVAIELERHIIATTMMGIRASEWTPGQRLEIVAERSRSIKERIDQYAEKPGTHQGISDRLKNTLIDFEPGGFLDPYSTS